MMKNRSFKVVNLYDERNIVNIFFWMLYPGFFFYHSAIGLGLFPALLGGFFTPVAIFAIIVLLPALLLRLKRPMVIDIVFFIIIFHWCTTLILYELLSDHSSAVKGDVLGWSLRAILGNLACFIVASRLDLERRYFFIVILVSLVAMLGIAIFNANDGLFYLRASADNNEAVATYQGFGRSVFVVSVVALVLSPRRAYSLIISFACAVLLFLNGARSEFIFFILVVFAYALIAINRSLIQGSLSLILLISVVLAVGSSYDYIEAYLPSARMLQLFDIQESSSAKSRAELVGHAWVAIQMNPIFGSYADYVPQYGIGAYAHNLMSAWADLGLVGLLLYSMATIGALVSSATLFIHKASKINMAAFFFSMALVSAMLFSKDYTDIIFGLTIGLCSSAFSAKKN